MTGRVVLAVMAKAPVAGQVKTRLCPPLAPAEAAALARCFLLDRLEQLGEVSDGDALRGEEPIADDVRGGSQVCRSRTPHRVLP